MNLEKNQTVNLIFGDDKISFKVMNPFSYAGIAEKDGKIALMVPDIEKNIRKADDEKFYYKLVSLDELKKEGYITSLKVDKTK